jgi:SAM-dependent methyltransferase
MGTANQVRADFDGIAELEAGGDGWNHNRHYHAFILGQLPATFEHAMEIGCGSGELARAIAVRARRVLAVDLSQKMIDRALAHVPEFSTIQYLVQDVGNWQWPREQFNVIVSVATLHHLPLAQMLAKCADALQPGGTLVVLDLYRLDTFADFVTCAIAFPINRIMQWWSPVSRELQEAFTSHGQHDRYLTLAEVRKAAAEAGLTGWRIRRHLFFRYSLTWVK